MRGFIPGMNSALSLLASAVASAAAPAYFPGQDYPDREEWLAKRRTASHTGRYMYFDSGRWGTMNVGINAAKRKARAERDFFRVISWTHGHPLHTIMREDGSPSLHRQLMTIRRKAQCQGPVTIEPNEAMQRQKAMKDKLK